MKIVLMAGGRGTRIASVNSDIPKPMIPVLGKPVLEYAIIRLREQGYKDIILVVGYLWQVIRDYFNDGSNWGVIIHYLIEDVPLGTAGALYLLKERLNEDFLLINGDIIFNIDIKKMYDQHKKNNGLVTIFTHPNNHPYDSGVIIADENGKVIEWLHKESERGWYKNRVNAGIHMISSKIFSKNNCFNKLQRLDLDRDILRPLITSGELYVYDSPEYVKDMGTPQRYQMVAADLSSGLVEAKNLTYKQKAVFLDRDGTINKYVGFLHKIDDFQLLPQAAEAIKIMNEKGYLVIVVTNQPVIARGDITEEGLQIIHNKMETLLGQEGAYVDAIYYCPHHPHKGYEGEITELKIDCDCRKPKPGLLLKASIDFNIDLQNSWVVGDSKNDIDAGKSAGCMTALLTDLGQDYGQKDTFRSLYDFADKVIK